MSPPDVGTDRPADIRTARPSRPAVPAVGLASLQHVLLATLGVLVAIHSLVEGLLLVAVAITGQAGVMVRA